MSKLEFTNEQKEVIRARDCNLLVSAAAGSGKTAVLVERIIGRLLDETSPASLDRLLVMTFTRAAAEGMKQKISEALSERIRAAEEKLAGITPEEEEYRKTEELLALLNTQETLLPRARISTIDSVCQNLIRQYFQYLDIDPAFRVADEAELCLLRADLLKDLLEEKYAEGAPDFLRFSEAFSKNGLDERISGLIRRMYDFASSRPWPREFLDFCEKEALEETEGGMWETAWAGRLREELTETCASMSRKLEKAEEILREPDGWKPYEELLSLLAARFEELTAVLSEGSFREAFEKAAGLASAGGFPRLSTRKCEAGDPQKKEEIRAVIDEARDLLGDLVKNYFSVSAENAAETVAESAKDQLVLLRLTREFMDRFAEKKKSRSVVDFGDMEHFCLELLYEVRDGKRVFTPLADELARGFDEILIDEYQDSNEVQEELLRALSAERFGRPDVFMVGDVKQSIYSFREARPELFMEKYRTYGSSGPCRKIELNKNFRSRPEVLDAVNDVFREVMKPSCGGILYDAAAELHPGRRDCFEEETGELIRTPAFVTELLLAEMNAEEPEGDPTPVNFTEEELEFVMIAQRILELTDPEKTSPAWQKKDITILMRNSGKAELLVDVLAAFGIDACFDSATGYFASQEISIMLAFLGIIDNPRQDIPLLTVLKSPMAAFTEEELALLRALYGRKEDGTPLEFYDALKRAAGNRRRDGSEETYGEGTGTEQGAAFRRGAGSEKTNPESKGPRGSGQVSEELLKKLCEKTSRFLLRLQEYRDLSGRLAVHELLHRIYLETGYYSYVSALPGGRKRRRNLDRLLEKAENYAATSYHGLFNFTRYIEQLKAYETDYGEAEGLSGTEDVVRVTTIHKSKGLEYPVTIVAGLDGRFNLSDTRESLLLDGELGLACDWVDTENRLRYPSLKRALLSARMRREQAGEELRVLYVAMTRAEDKLILAGKVNNLEKKKKEGKQKKEDIASVITQQQILLRGGACEKVSFYLRICEKTVLERMDPGSLKEEKEDGKDFRSFLEKLRDGQGCPDNVMLTDEASSDTALSGTEKTDIMLTCAGLGSQNSGTGTAEAGNRAGEKERVRENSAELEELRRRIHAVYAHEEETKLRPKVSVSELKARLITETEYEFVRDLEENRQTKGAEYGTIVHRAFELLDYGKDGEEALPDLPGVDAGTMQAARRVIAAFRKTDLAEEMKKAALAGRLYREQHFMIGLPAWELTPGSESSELQLMQGIIDAYILEPEGIKLIDYKTDRVETEEKLLSRYALQLELYARALEQLLRRPVTEKIIYSTCLNKAIRL